MVLFALPTFTAGVLLCTVYIGVTLTLTWTPSLESELVSTLKYCQCFSSLPLLYLTHISSKDGESRLPNSSKCHPNFFYSVFFLHCQKLRIYKDIWFPWVPFRKWFSTFLMLWLSNAVPQTMVIPNYKIVLVATS